MFIAKLVCCYHKLTAFLIQYLLLLINIIGIILNIIGLIIIKWEYISSGIKFIYVICFLIYILSTFCICILIFFRQKKTINKRNNKISIKISITNIILSLIGIFFSIICLIVGWIQYNDSNVKGWNKFFMFLFLGGNLRMITFVFSFWIAILIRLIKKTNGAYIEKEVEPISNISTSTISDNRDVKVSYGIRELNLK